MRTFEINSQIRLASLAVQNGHVADARHILETVRDAIPSLQDKMLQFRFYRELGDVATEENRWEEAEQSLEWILQTGYASISRLQVGKQRESWTHALGEAAISLGTLRFRRTGDVAEAVRLFQWQWELQLEPLHM